MKNIYRAIMALLLAGTVSSCEKVLDKAPDGEITLEEVFSDPEMVGAFLNSCYGNIKTKGINYNGSDCIPVSLTDDAWSSSDDQGLNVSNAYLGLVYDYWNTTRDEVGDWYTLWYQVRLCSQFIDHIDNATVRSEEERSRWKAEACILKAYFYSELVKWYGRVPIQRETYRYDGDFSGTVREPVVEVVKYIEELCDEALSSPSLPWRITTSAETMRVTKALAWAIKSEMWLFAASPLHNGGQNYWQKAYEVNRDAVKALKDEGYELFTTCSAPETYGTGPAAAYHQLACTAMQYSSMPTDRETIWQHAHGAAQTWKFNYVGIEDDMYQASGCPTQELVDAYEVTDGTVAYPLLDLSRPYADERHLQPNYNPAALSLYDENDPYANRDPRFYVSVVYNGSEIEVNGNKITMEIYQGGRHGIEHDQGAGRHTRTGYYNRKTVVPGAGGRLNILGSPWKFYRLAGVMLNLAEAAVESGNLSDAYDAVNEIRRRVGMPGLPPGLTQDELRYRVRNERRIELSWEETRYFDLRRWQSPDGDLAYHQKYLTRMYIRKDPATGQYTYERANIWDRERFGYENRDLFLPLKDTEVSKIWDVTGDNWQNPGWY